MSEDLSVGQVAELGGVSVRTLHHWDEIGLVTPARTFGDYRVYSPSDVARIQRVLVYREAGLPLAEVRALIDDPAASERDHLLRQRELLAARISQLHAKVAAVNRLLEAPMELSNEKKAEIFGTDWRADWDAEAKERWGETEAWAQSQQRISRMTKSEAQAMKEAGELLNVDLAAALAAGVKPGSAAANELAERHRALISELYDCTHAMQVCLGRLYVSDARFAEYYDAHAAGLAVWLAAVIDANARTHGVDPDTASWQ